MQPPYRPNVHKSYSTLTVVSNDDRTPHGSAPQVNLPAPKGKMHVKRVTLTSKKNWWMVEMDEDEENAQTSANPFSSSEETVVEPSYGYGLGTNQVHQPDSMETDTPPPSPIYNPPRQPTSIFSFPTPIAYSAPPNPTASLLPCAQGSASELFKCVVKKPNVIQLEINGEMQSNASDVTVQFLAELRVYTTLARHRNICAFLGSLENVGMVLEYIEGRTLYDVVISRPPMIIKEKVDYHNQLLDGLTHLHSYRLSHGDLSLLNVQVTTRSNTIKLLDFGRSVCADSEFAPPDDGPVDPFAYLRRSSMYKGKKVEQIHPGTRPFSAPEVLRGECKDPLLADAYSFGMILVCLDRCESVDVKPWDQRKDILPKDLFNGCEVFGERVKEYLKKWDCSRRRLKKDDMIQNRDKCANPIPAWLIVMSVFFPGLSINARLAAIMDNILAIGLGLAVRYVIDVVSRGDMKMTGTLVGMWEGVVLSHFLKKMPNSFDPLLGYAVRLFFDYLVNERVTRLVLVIVWTGLGVILADITPALWVDVGLHRYWRRFRRDIYYMSRSMTKVDIFPRARTVRFSPRHTTAILSDAESTVTPSVVSTAQLPRTTRPPVPIRITSKRHVPGSFESDVDTITEPGSVPVRQRELPAHSPQPLTPRRRQSIWPSFTPITRDTASDVTSVGQDVDDGNLSSPVSSGLTEDVSAVNPNEIPDELELEYIDTKVDGTPKQSNLGLPTPTDSVRPFGPLRHEEDYVKPPPPADIRTIPDTDDANGVDGWENIDQGEAVTSKNPPPQKNDEQPVTKTTSLPSKTAPPPTTQAKSEQIRRWNGGQPVTMAPPFPSQTAPPPTTHAKSEQISSISQSQTSTANSTDPRISSHVKRDSAQSDKPPSYRATYEFQDLSEKPPADTEEEVWNSTHATEPPSGEEQVKSEDGAEDVSSLSDLSETTLQSLEGLSCLDQMAKLHQLIKKARREYESAEQKHKSVQTSGNKAMAEQAKAEMDERERRLKKLTNKAEACFLTHNQAGRKFAEEVDLSNLDNSATEEQVGKALEQFLRPSTEQVTLRFLATKGRPGNPQKDHIMKMVKALGLTSRRDVSNGRIVLVNK